MNRKDGLPFVEEDLTLLTAFGGQAAVAMENARLYTLTDQELAARVEELSVMQRIDRELNASLETDRAMRITLDWALRQSNAEAGLIGMVEEDKLRRRCPRRLRPTCFGNAEQPCMPLDSARAAGRRRNRPPAAHPDAGLRHGQPAARRPQSGRHPHPPRGLCHRFAHPRKLRRHPMPIWPSSAA